MIRVKSRAIIVALACCAPVLQGCTQPQLGSSCKVLVSHGGKVSEYRGTLEHLNHDWVVLTAGDTTSNTHLE